MEGISKIVLTAEGSTFLALVARVEKLEKENELCDAIIVAKGQFDEMLVQRIEKLEAQNMTLVTFGQGYV